MRFEAQHIKQLSDLLYQAPMPVRRVSFSGQGLHPEQIYLYTGGQSSQTLVLQRSEVGFVLREMQGDILAEAASMDAVIRFLSQLPPSSGKPQIPTLPSITEEQELDP